MVFWWYKNATLRSNKLKKAILKKTEKYVIKHVFIKPLFFVSDDFFQVVFLFFPHLIYLPQLIVDKKRISVIFKQKGKEIVNWHKNEGFPEVSKGKGWNYCISNLEYIPCLHFYCWLFITFLFGIIISKTVLTEIF